MSTTRHINTSGEYQIKEWSTEMQLISREQLKAQLDRGDDFKLVMTLEEWAYRLKHIPGSINIFPMDITKGILDPNDEIVLYCAAPECAASVVAYQRLNSSGYKNVRRYAGGIADWEEAGYPLEGEFAASTSRELVAA